MISVLKSASPVIAAVHGRKRSRRRGRRGRRRASARTGAVERPPAAGDHARQAPRRDWTARRAPRPSTRPVASASTALVRVWPPSMPRNRIGSRVPGTGKRVPERRSRECGVGHVHAPASTSSMCATSSEPAGLGGGHARPHLLLVRQRSRRREHVHAFVRDDGRDRPAPARARSGRARLRPRSGSPTRCGCGGRTRRQTRAPSAPRWTTISVTKATAPGVAGPHPGSPVTHAARPCRSGAVARPACRLCTAAVRGGLAERHDCRRQPCRGQRLVGHGDAASRHQQVVDLQGHEAAIGNLVGAPFRQSHRGGAGARRDCGCRSDSRCGPRHPGTCGRAADRRLSAGTRRRCGGSRARRPAPAWRPGGSAAKPGTRRWKKRSNVIVWRRVSISARVRSSGSSGSRPVTRVMLTVTSSTMGTAEQADDLARDVDLAGLARLLPQIPQPGDRP